MEKPGDGYLRKAVSEGPHRRCEDEERIEQRQAGCPRKGACQEAQQQVSRGQGEPSDRDPEDRGSSRSRA